MTRQIAVELAVRKTGGQKQKLELGFELIQYHCPSQPKPNGGVGIRLRR
jgi:hypothetical protein